MVMTKHSHTLKRRQLPRRVLAISRRPSTRRLGPNEKDEGKQKKNKYIKGGASSVLGLCFNTEIAE